VSVTTEPPVTETPGTAQPEPSRPRGKRRSWVPKWALAAPAWLWFLLFFVAPVGLVFYYSFGYKPGIFDTVATDKLSFDRYVEAFEPAYVPIFKNTLQISIIGTFLCLIVALPFAYWLAVKVDPKWRGLLLGLVLVPFWTNFLVRTIGWQIILAPDGFLSGFLQDIKVLDSPLGIDKTRTAVQIGVIYNYLPLMILPLFVAFDRLDATLREASKDLYAGRWATFRQVSLPIAMPGVVAGLLLVFIPLMGDYITASLLGGAQGTMIGVLVANMFQSAQNWALGSATAVLLIGFILGTAAIFALLGLLVRTLIRRNRRIDLEGVV
jgi:spermidine/putrescine transport system permease protein